MFPVAARAAPTRGRPLSPSSGPSAVALSFRQARRGRRHRLTSSRRTSLSKSCTSCSRQTSRRMPDERVYLRDGDAIYTRSFAIIREEADLARFAADQAAIAVRMIHACGLVEAAAAIEFSDGFVAAAHAALARGAPVFCDAEMVAHGIIRRFLPAHNEVICTLNDARVHELATALATTRSAAALDLWGERLAGAL